MSNVCYAQRRWDARRTTAIARFEENLKQYALTAKAKRDAAKNEKDKTKSEELLATSMMWQEKRHKIEGFIVKTQANMGIGSSAYSKDAPVSVSIPNSDGFG